MEIVKTVEKVEGRKEARPGLTSEELFFSLIIRL